ncbi:MAG: GspE/PulE family protein [Candidatus Nanosyncoccaceae bacterium]|jgi:type IV pilus assembly protein PilB
MTVLTSANQTQIVKILVDEGLVDASVLQEVKEDAKTQGKPLISYLIESGTTDTETITHINSIVLGLPYVNLTDVIIKPEILELMPGDIAERTMSVPLAEVDGRLAVAMIDASNVQAVDYLSSLVKRPIKVFMASAEGIRHVLEQYSTDFSAVDAAAQASQQESRAESDSANITTIVQDSPISKALYTILEYAVKNRASDVHIEPLESSLKIRCRVDGVLREIMQLPKSIEPALVSRIKILSNLKIDEHRIPQDGQFTIAVAGKEVDLRIAISPVVWGEQVVIRLLDKSGSRFTLEQLGFTGRSLRMIQKGMRRPNGMVLTSGPTGSGKTTTLYALVREIMDDTVNIVTLEDPVEYKMAGVNQIQVNTEVGLTFATGLRSILRQDPDIIMVGEIRDPETANLAVQAALTGHLVFSTLHTNSAAGVLPRLLDMGVEPYLIASTVNTVIGQRLVRRIAKDNQVVQTSDLETKMIKSVLGDLLPKTKEEITSVSEDLGYPSLPLANQSQYSLRKGIDSKKNPGGYSGRAGIYEVMDIDESIQNLIIQKATSTQIHKAGIAQGMVTLRQDGYLKALSGITTIEEVNRVAADA